MQKKKMVLHSHNTGTVGVVRKVLHNINRVKLEKYPGVRIACSQDAGKWMFCNSGFTVVPNGVEVEKFRFDVNKREKIRKSLNIDEKDFVLGFVGRIEKQKNPLFLIELMEIIRKKMRNALLIIVGDGSMKEKVLAFARDKRVEDSILFVGNQKDVSDWYSAFDIFVLPSIFEGFGIVALEAQVSGLISCVSDKVCSEIHLSPLAREIPLDKHAEEWAEKIVGYSFEKIARYENYQYFSHSEYSIVNSMKLLEQIYTSRKIR